METADNIRIRELARAQPRVFAVLAGVAVVQILACVPILAGDPNYPRERLVAVMVFGFATLPLAWLSRAPSAPGARRGLRRRVVPLAAMLLFGCMMAAVEGPLSPMSPLLFHVVIGQAARHGFRGAAWVTLGAALAIIVSLALLPAAWFGPPLGEPYRTWMWSVMLGGVLLSITVEVASMHDTYHAAAAQLDEMRETILRDHAARSRALETIGAKVAHELKNPLTSIKALLQMMGDDAADDDAVKRFEVLDGEVERMQTILHDYLTFARPLDELHTTRVPLLGLLHHTHAVLEARAEDAGVTFEVSGDDVAIRGDEGRLRAALLNVMGNALEASGDGTVVRATVARISTGARIVVQDEGRGMSSQELEKLGTPFFSTKERGTGLGVVITMATVKQHGGHVTFESRQREGTRVVIELPDVASPTGDPTRSYEKMAHLDAEKLRPPPR